MPKSKKMAYEEKYYSLSEEEIQTIITAAKSGSAKDQLQLLEIFSNFLSKYVTCLYNGKYSIGDYDIRRFVALFVKDPNTRFYLVRNKLNPSGVKHVAEVMRGIQYMITRYGDREDVEQTVHLAFLECITTYQRKPPIPFSGFLYSYFFYILKKKVDLLLIDQLGRKTFPLIADDDYGDEDSENTTPGFTAPPTPGADEFIMTEEIDEHWVMGVNATGPFATLTLQERQLLKWRYVDGERSSDIAERITEHPNTVREHYHKIREKITLYLLEELKEVT